MLPALPAQCSALHCRPVEAQRVSGAATAPARGETAPAGAGLADVIVADTLDRLSERIDIHFHKGEYNHAVNLCRIKTQGLPHDVEAFSNAAYLLWSMAQDDDAEALLKAGLEKNSNSYYMYDELGSFYSVHLKRYAEAIPYYEKAVGFKCPFSTWHLLANCYEKTNQWDKALHAWQSAAKYPDDRLAPVRVRRAEAHLRGMTRPGAR
jgi:tetratricopeptide (TPR) repeat protein